MMTLGQLRKIVETHKRDGDEVPVTVSVGRTTLSMSFAEIQCNGTLHIGDGEHVRDYEFQKQAGDGDLTDLTKWTVRRIVAENIV